MFKKIKPDSKRLLTLVLWGNPLGFLCGNIIVSKKYPLASFGVRDLFEVALCVLILGFLGGYFTAQETNGKNRHNILARFVENVWFTALMAFVLGLPGFIVGVVLR